MARPPWLRQTKDPVKVRAIFHRFRTPVVVRAKDGTIEKIDGHAMDADPFFALAHQIQDRLLAERQACAKVNSEGPA